MLQGSLVVGGISSGALAATRVPVALCLGAGLVLGLLAVASAIYLEPLLARHLRTPQPYLSLSVHGLPALLGGLLGVALAAVSEEKAGVLNLLLQQVQKKTQHCLCLLLVFSFE